MILSSVESNIPAFNHLLNEMFLSTSIKVIFLLYDSQSIDLATTFLTTPTAGHHEWLTINVDSKLQGSESDFAPSVSDQNLIITVLNNSKHWQIVYYKDMIKYSDHANFLFVSSDESLEMVTIYKRLESLHKSRLHCYSAVLVHLTASTLNCYTLKYHFDNRHQLILIEFSSNRTIFEQLFWNRYKQLDKRKLAVTALMRFPYLLVGKRRSKEMPEQYDYGVSGNFIYMTGLMADYLNATLDLFIYDMGDYKYNKKTLRFNLTSEKNAYIVDDRVPLVQATRQPK